MLPATKHCCCCSFFFFFCSWLIIIIELQLQIAWWDHYSRTIDNWALTICIGLSTYLHNQQSLLCLCMTWTNHICFLISYTWTIAFFFQTTLWVDKPWITNSDSYTDSRIRDESMHSWCIHLIFCSLTSFFFLCTYSKVHSYQIWFKLEYTKPQKLHIKIS